MHSFVLFFILFPIAVQLFAKQAKPVPFKFPLWGLSQQFPFILVKVIELGWRPEILKNEVLVKVPSGRRKTVGLDLVASSRRTLKRGHVRQANSILILHRRLLPFVQVTSLFLSCYVSFTFICASFCKLAFHHLDGVFVELRNRDLIDDTILVFKI
jgi:hypothetical protein